MQGMLLFPSKYVSITKEVETRRNAFADTTAYEASSVGSFHGNPRRCRRVRGLTKGPKTVTPKSWTSETQGPESQTLLAMQKLGLPKEH